MLQVKNLTKTFKKNTVVNDITFTVNPGEIVGLLGENGAGKTTTLRMISTMLKITSGEAIVNNYSASIDPIKVRNEIGILFGGDVGLYDRLTARENIRYFANLYGIDNKEADKRIDELSKRFQMDEYIDKRVSKFSRGMKQKVSIARSIVHSPSVMLFDEPSTGLDVTAARTIQDFILSCKEEGKTILFSSHSMAEVEKLCDRVVIINKGKLIENCSINTLKTKYNNDNLEDVFVSLIGGNSHE
ncbi:ATP-binding cassette domain-containing protein [Clostridium sardiniense]|uniref:ATP-binding cassette domain-containing protein n=1 Tax=Clostridium sardiniense TaxID=29369 RepID=A0ABS7KZE3_CLOSR|nr:ATP-binding cassette domain-containing protein [Clostridium sardiniense]MBY0755962.1 ATP-binding cassette domain-containing protein [Clostridium sardiniense]MDQ0460748.1 sodium transport system ATP-binding protein [Clostridium sardiniense]